MEGEKNPLVYDDLYKSWEYVDEDGSIVRLTEEDKNDLLAQSPADAQYLRRRVYTPDEKRMLNQVAEGKVLEGDVNAAARFVFPKAMAEAERDLNREEKGERPEGTKEFAKGLGRQAYAGVGDLFNLGGRMAYAAGQDEKPFVESVQEDYGNVDEKTKDVLWHLSRDKFLAPMLLAGKRIPTGKTAAAGGVIGGATAAAPVALDALAGYLLDAQTIPEATKDKPLESIAAAAGLGSTLGALGGRVGGSAAARAVATKANEALTALGEGLGSVLKKDGLLEALQKAIATENPVSIANRFAAARKEIGKAPMTEAQKAQAVSVLNGIEQDVNEILGVTKAKPSKVGEAVENAFKGAEEAGAAKAETEFARKYLKDALSGFDVKRANKVLKDMGVEDVTITADDIEHIMALKPDQMPKPSVLDKFRSIAERVGVDVDELLSYVSPSAKQAALAGGRAVVDDKAAGAAEAVGSLLGETGYAEGER